MIDLIIFTRTPRHNQRGLSQPIQWRRRGGGCAACERTSAGGDNGTGIIYENVGKYQSVLIMIDPIIFTHTRRAGRAGEGERTGRSR
jgi:hypothetical protein